MLLRCLSSVAFVVVLSAVLAIAFVVPREPPVVPGPIVRGSELVAGSPSGPIAAVGGFTWKSPYGKAAYRVTVVDAAGAVRFTSFTSQEGVAMPRNQAARLAPGRYSWKVEAFDEQGKSLGASRAQPFEILPP
jgi:hypothetical protein